MVKNGTMVPLTDWKAAEGGMSHACKLERDTKQELLPILHNVVHLPQEKKILPNSTVQSLLCNELNWDLILNDIPSRAQEAKNWLKQAAQLSLLWKHQTSCRDYQRRRKRRGRRWQLPLAWNNARPSAEYEKFQRVPLSCVCAALAVTFFMEVFEGSAKPPGGAGDTERELKTLTQHQQQLQARSFW